jgi:predicted  nucleic acid-binding Zn-ribbon protein
MPNILESEPLFKWVVSGLLGVIAILGGLAWTNLDKTITETRTDLRMLQTEMRTELKAMQAESQADRKALSAETQAELKTMQQQIFDMRMTNQDLKTRVGDLVETLNNFSSNSSASSRRR